MRDWSKRLCSTVLAATLLVSNIQPVFAFAEEAEDTGLCEHHVTHENCGYVAAVAGADCKHEHDNGCFTVKCTHVHGDCGYVAAVEGVDCDHQHDGACGYAEAVAEVPCTCQQEEHTEDCAYAPAIPEVKCNHVHGECSFVEAKSEIPCGHDCTQDEACGEKVLNCVHRHDESCGYVAAVEGKACDFVCEVCAAEEASAAAVAEVKALMEALPELEAVRAMSMEEQKAAYEQTQAAYEAYGKLTADQQQELADPEEVFKPLFEYFNMLVDADGEIGSGTPDGTPPVITSLSFNSATEITAPGTIEMVAEGTDEVSGVSHINVNFTGQNNKKTLSCSLSSTYWQDGKEVAYSDGKLHGKITVDQYLETDTFKLNHVSIHDNAGNGTIYGNNGPSTWLPLTDYMEALQFNVTNVGADITTSTNQSTFVEDVKNAADDAYIVADFSSNSTLPQGAFDGIAGTNKTLDLTSEGVTWRFEGNDITEDTKSIDLSVQITKAESNTSDAGQAIQDKLNDTPGYIMKFAENGTLPGKATIQVKVDYAMREHLGSSTGLNVYYYNNQTGKLELVAEKLSVINDTYVEFSITHCSYYVLTTALSSELETKVITCPYTEEITLTQSEEDRYYSFTPTVSGVYVASVPWFDGEGDAGSYVEITDDSGVIGETDGYRTDYRVARATLEAGNVYTIHIGTTGATAGQKLIFAFAQSTSPTGVDIGRETDELYILPGGSRGVASANLMPINAVGDITWNCDNTDVIQLRNNTGYNCSFNILKAGTVVLTASCGDYQDTITITIKEPDVLTKGTIVSGSTYVDKGDGFYYYSFTANEAGRYEFKTRNLSIHHIVTAFEFANGEAEDRHDIKRRIDGKIRYDYITLEDGETCFFYVVGYDDCNYTIAVNEEGAAPEDNFIKLLEPSGDIRPALVGSTVGVTVAYSPWDAEKDLTYSISDSSVLAYDEHAGVSNGFCFKCLKEGAATVTITDSYTGKSVSQEVTVVAPKIVNNVPYEDTIDVPVGSHYELYSFTPSETGVYTVSRNMDMSQYGASIYVEGGNLYTGIGGTQRTLLLDAGSTYLFEVRFVQCNGTETDVFKIVKSAGVENQPLMLLQDAVTVTMQPWHENTYSNIQMHYSGNGVVTGSSSNPDVAEFSSAMNGYLTILVKKAGTATITVTDGTYSDTITVTVKDVTYLQLDKPLAVNTVDTNLFAFIAPEDGRYAFTMAVKDGTLSSRLEITIDGVYSYSFTETTSTIAVELEAGKTFSFMSVGMLGEEVTITATKIEAAPTAMRLIPGVDDNNRLVFCVGFTPTASGDRIVKWETSNRNILGERNENPNSATKVFDIYDNGEVTVTATSETGLKASCTLVLGTCGDNLKWFLHDGTLTIFGSGAMDSFTSSGPWSNWQSQITSIVVNEGVTNIGEHAFENCKNITSVSLPDSISSIGYCAFRYCEKLTSINLPINLTTLSKGTFVGCKSLTEIALPSKITEISEQLFTGCTSLSSVMIPNGVTKIWNMAFQDTALTKVVLPDSVTSLGGAAFANCKNLTEVVFSKNITTIELSTFAGCSGLTSITIPSHITTIKDSAFRGCSGLKKITFEGNAPTFEDSFSDGNTAFADVTATAYYPVGNATWTESVMQNYGGNITWKPYCPNGHTVVTDKAVEATCTATGLTEGKHCSACGEVLTAQTTVSAKGHNYVNGYCSRCGVAAPTSGGSTGGNGSTNNGSSTNTGTGNAGTTTRPTTKPNQNGVELSAKELEASADRNASTTIAVDGIRVTFDAKAQKAIAEQAAKDTIKLHYEEIKEVKLSNTQKKAIKNHLSDHKGQKHVMTFTISLLSGGKEIHDFKGGIATLKIPFTANPGTKGSEYKVFFVDNNGDIIPMETTYENGCLVVKLTHFSEYVVLHVPEEVDEEATEATEANTTTELAVDTEEPVTVEVQNVQPVKAPKADAVGMILRIVLVLCTVGIVVIGVILLSMRKNKK